MSCNPNTLLSDGATFQTLSERDQTICIAQLLCDISSSGGGGGTVKFGDPAGVTVNGGLAYDTLGNLWADLDPSGAHNWQKIISAQAAAPVMALAARRSPDMVVAVLEPPKAEELPPVTLPKPRNRWREALASLRLFPLFSLFFLKKW